MKNEALFRTGSVWKSIISMAVPSIIIILVMVLYNNTDVPADVESAGEVIERDGADAGHEDALEHAFNLLEHLAVEAAGVSEGWLLYTSRCV